MGPGSVTYTIRSRRAVLVAPTSLIPQHSRSGRSWSDSGRMTGHPVLIYLNHEAAHTLTVRHGLRRPVPVRTLGESFDFGFWEVTGRPWPCCAVNSAI